MKKKIVFFNASVILAGLASQKGGSAKVLTWVKRKKITGLISEIILDETIRHAEKISFNKEAIKMAVLTIFNQVCPAPKKSQVAAFGKLVIDSGDCHVIASSLEQKADYLVTLDKKHLLILKKIKTLKIVSPGELIRKLKFLV